MQNLKLKDIAEKLDLSISTVSKALKDYPDVKKTTKKKVLKYTKKVNFKPNAQASFLRTQKTKIIGVIVPTIIHHFYSKIVEGIILIAEKTGYMVITRCAEESFEKEKKLVKELMQQNVDGVFISISNYTRETSHLQEVINSKTTLIVFDRISKFLSCSNVMINDRDAAYQATKHLIDQGCNSIAHFRGGLLPQIAVDRYLGYRMALEDHNIKYRKELLEICKNSSEKEGYDNAKKLYDSKIKYDGLFAFSDPTAAGAIRFYQKNNIDIPKDIAIVGFSNWELSSYTTPTISTIDHSSLTIGEEMMRLFLKEITQLQKNEKIIFQNSIIPSKLIVRESSTRKLFIK
tara:strand:+ start:8539 stop:9576 length:1038 start_codon:yes stop_codon:yes gene_type:complete